MKKINLKSPRYILPVIALPFILILFGIYHHSSAAGDQKSKPGDSLRSDFAEVSPEVLHQKLQDKLQASQGRFNKGDKFSPLGDMTEEELQDEQISSAYSQQQKQMLDSIESSIVRRYRPQANPPSIPRAEKYPADRRDENRSLLMQDRSLAQALTAMQRPTDVARDEQRIKREDPMEIFRAQMAIVDSIGKANDPQYKEQIRNQKKAQESLITSPGLKTLKVSAGAPIIDSGFNTLRAAEPASLNIPAIIDEQVTGFSGSRIRMRLLTDIWAGKYQVKKGSYLYGTISSFSAQRIQVSVSSVLAGSEILPIRLDVYDRDGQRGIYVPSSAFREFTKDLGSTGQQGISIDGASEENKQLMSLLGRVFSSSSSAVTRLIRQNKAKIKYASIIYLIDPAEQQSKQRNF